MRLAVLHLSDIHIQTADDPILKHARDIARACYPSVHKCDACLIVVTGDISSSGATTEYEIAEAFLLGIKQHLEDEGCPFVDIFLVPGNHDCVLRPESRARTLLIERILESPQEANDASVIEFCTKAQDNYFEFRKRITVSPPKLQTKLWSEYQLDLAGASIRISAINASWMSRIPEAPGTLVYPTEAFEECAAEPSDLRLALIHHPLNWYTQNTYHPLRRLLRSRATAILSGHEHVHNSGLVSETGTGESLFFESGALQPRQSGLPHSFALLDFSLEENCVTSSTFEIRAGEVKGTGQATLSLEAASVKHSNQLEITQEFQSHLLDPGGTFIHPDKDRLELDDVYVYPALREHINDASSAGEDIPSKSLLSEDHRDSRILFLGEDRGGKSTLLKTAFRMYHEQGLVPVLLSGSEFRSSSTKEIQKRIQAQIATQYVHPETVARTERERKIALLDDLDRIRGGAKALPALINAIERDFAGVILTADTGFRLTELLQPEAIDALSNYKTYKIQQFGYELRHELVKRWCLCGPVSTKQQLDERVDALEQQLETITRRYLVPWQPFYLLVLLQSCERNQVGELQGGGFSHYYQYLITSSMRDVGVKTEQLDELFNYLSQLAWLYKSAEAREVDFVQLREFNRAFSERYISVDLAPRLELLCRAKILTRRGDSIAFSYPYIYFFFLGNYLAENLQDPSMRALVQSWCEQLYRRENGYTILFLAHHRNDRWVIEQVAAALRKCLDGQKPMTFDGEVDGINRLVDATPELVMDAPDVDKNQVEVRKLRDKLEPTKEADESEELANDIEMFRNWNLLLKTAEILGQILKSYYGSLEKSLKAELLREVFDGPLRLLRSFIETAASEPDQLAKAIRAAVEKSNPNAEFTEKDIREMTFGIVHFVCLGVVGQTGYFVASPKLREDVADVVSANGSTAYRLIEMAARLTRPGRLPLDDIRRLAKNLESNQLAFEVLRALGFLHLHLFHVPPEDIRILCAHLKISLQKVLVERRSAGALPSTQRP